MTNEERRVLTQFLEQLAAVKGVHRDPEADQLIADAAARQPDAVYLLVQRALLQEQGLSAAKARIEQLQGELAQARAAGRPARGGFLGNDPWAAPARAATPAGGAWPAAAPATGFGGGMGSFLGTAAATAAGIAGGAFLFQGIENLLGHHHGSGGFLDSANLGHDPVENVTINEYHGSDPDVAHEPEPDQDFRDAGFLADGSYGDDDDNFLNV